MTADRAVTILFPVTKLVVVGTGPIADALCAAAVLLGWQTQITNDQSTATRPHRDRSLLSTSSWSPRTTSSSPALRSRPGLDSEVGYIGALGGRKMQQARADWLAYRGITELDRIHGPAGLDIGADTPAEVAISILAEAVAVEAGKPVPRTLDLDDAAR